MRVRLSLQIEKQKNHSTFVRSAGSTLCTTLRAALPACPADIPLVVTSGEEKGDLVMAILRNAIRCKRCGDVIESKHRHDFRTCSCGAVAVDGGYDYLRRIHPCNCDSDDAYEELSVTDSEEEED